MGQLWQGPLAGSGTQQQYLYCNSQPHELSGLYASGATCTNQTGQVYASSYDSWGNVTSGTTATLTYDLLDHFVSWNVSSTNKELYIYDASGTRVLRCSVTSSGTTMTVYAFGLEEHRYGGAGVHQGDLYYYSLGGRLLGASDGTNTTFYLTGTLGSVLASFSNVATSAAIQGNQVFGPYGNARDYQGTINTAKGFTGQYTDSLTELDYYGSRYYDQVAGVFLSADVKQGNMQGMNPYAYVGGNPETKNDPTGEYFAPSGGNCSGELPSCTQLGDCSSTVCGCTFSIDTNPPPPIKPILPGTPEWQSIGNVFAFGYRYGEMVVLASIEAIVDAHPRGGWNDGNTSLSSGQVISYLLALLAQQYRKEHQDETPYGEKNIALAYWWATDSNGNVTFGDITDPVVGTNNPGDAHAEEKLVNDFVQNVAPNLGLSQGDEVHYIMYSEIHPCASCTPQLRSWANRMSKAIGPGINFNFDVFDTRPDPRYRGSVVSPTNTKAYYYYSYWNDIYGSYIWNWLR